jgi:transposase
MMGRKHREQASLFYEFRLDEMIPKGHLLRRINVFVTSVLGDLHEHSDIGRPSIDSELLIRMLIIGDCFAASAPRGSYARR